MKLIQVPDGYIPSDWKETKVHYPEGSITIAYGPSEMMDRLVEILEELYELRKKCEAAKLPFEEIS